MCLSTVFFFFRTFSSFEDFSGREHLRKGEKGKKEENRVESPLEIYFFGTVWWTFSWNILVNFCCLLSRLLSKHPQPTAMRRHLPLTKSTTDWQSRCLTFQCAVKPSLCTMLNVTPPFTYLLILNPPSTTDWQSRCVRLFSTVYFHMCAFKPALCTNPQSPNSYIHNWQSRQQHRVSPGININIIHGNNNHMCRWVCGGSSRNKGFGPYRVT